jgi:predicted AAA+ superfamily ATPase
MPPRYLHQLPQLRARQQEAVEAAENNGAFTYAQQLQRGLPRLYIRHEGLFQEVTGKLRQEAAAAASVPGMAAEPGVRGVLITGSRGTGKSTLARDVALSLQAGEWRQGVALDERQACCQANGSLHTSMPHGRSCIPNVVLHTACSGGKTIALVC